MTLRFGVAAADITPDMPTELSGFASRTGQATGTLDPLMVQILVLSDGWTHVALAAFDLLGIPDDLGPTIAARLWPGLNVIPCATHTHAGPPVLARSLLGVASAAYIDRLAVLASDAIRIAWDGLRPGRLAHRKVDVPGIAHNRRDPAGPVDHAADVIALHDAAGSRAALWVNFACHPVVLGPDNLSYSADYPGAVRRVLAARCGVPVLATTGCCGQINLGHSARDSIRGVGLDRRTPAEMMRIGTLLAETIAADIAREPMAPVAAHAVEYAMDGFAAEYTALDNATRATLAQDAHRVHADPAATRGERRMADIDLAWLARTHDAARMTLGVMCVAELACVFLPGEIFVETSLALQRHRPGAMVVGYAYANPGYIPHRTAQGGYEVDIAWRPYGAPGPFAPGTADRLEAMARALLP